MLYVAFVRRKVPQTMDPNLALCLYRVAQEALHNVVKHSGQRAATLTLTGTRKEVRLAVQDQGAGFEPDPAGGRRGLGIASMEERVRLVGGIISIQSRLGAGVRVEVVAPLGGAQPGGFHEAAASVNG